MDWLNVYLYDLKNEFLKVALPHDENEGGLDAQLVSNFRRLQIAKHVSQPARKKIRSTEKGAYALIKTY